MVLSEIVRRGYEFVSVCCVSRAWIAVMVGVGGKGPEVCVAAA